MNENGTVNESARHVVELQAKHNLLSLLPTVRHLAQSAFLIRLLALFSLLFSVNAFAANEETLGVLQIGNLTYQNIRVTSKAKSYILIMHSGGMASIKVKDLPDDVRLKLGYSIASTPKAQPEPFLGWPSRVFGKLDFAQLKKVQARLFEAWQGSSLSTKVHLPPLTAKTLTIFAGTLLLVYLFISYCCLLICQKASYEPGVFVWLPLLQLFPMLRAASMSAWWVVLCLIPVVNVVAYVLWCANIVKARNKTLPLMFLLLLPITNILAFLYLAFSEAGPQKPNLSRREILTLQTA